VTATAIRFDGERSSIAVATSYGPRIVGLYVNDRNLFAELSDDDVLRGPDGRPYHLRGGHRLWVAPEVPEITYRSDDDPCSLSRLGDGIHVEGRPDGAGFSKAITITGSSEGWLVDHRITNHGRTGAKIAPWAISQFRPGGRVTLALELPSAGLQANRAVAWWPYTDPADPRIRIGTDAVEIEARQGAAMKIGVVGASGWARYGLANATVTVRTSVDPLASYPDLGAAIQAYVCDRFCEVETLGPLRVVAPGGSITHREEWIVS
jgi:hypothetical protein